MSNKPEDNLELLANLAQLLSFYILLNDNTAEKLDNISQRLERLEELINRLTVVNLHDTH